MNQNSLFTKYNGALLYIGLPHQDIKIDKKVLKRQIIETKCLFARYTSDSQLITPPPKSILTILDADVTIQTAIKIFIGGIA